LKEHGNRAVIKDEPALKLQLIRHPLLSGGEYRNLRGKKRSKRLALGKPKKHLRLLPT
jgi:hypothetical protein